MKRVLKLRRRCAGDGPLSPAEAQLISLCLAGHIKTKYDKINNVLQKYRKSYCTFDLYPRTAFTSLDLLGTLKTVQNSAHRRTTTVAVLGMP